MSPQLFLQIGGGLFLLLGLFGFVAPNTLDGMLQLSDQQNIVHVVLGLASLVLGFVPWAGLEKRWAALIIALIALFFGLMGFVWSENPFNALGMTDFEDPLDNILYIIIGIWGIATMFTKKEGVNVIRA
jgi:uncharacterized membrane protein YuzA (DUF378 family)